MEDNESLTENEDEQEHQIIREVIEVHPKGVPESVGVIMGLVIIILSAFALYPGQRESPACTANNETLRLQAAANQVTAQLTAESQRQDMEWRGKLVKLCVDAGHVPVLIGGNLDCKVLPK